MYPVLGAHFTAIFVSTVVASGAAGMTTAKADVGPVITPATRPGEFREPLDAAPSPQGDTIYFVAQARNGKSRGVFSVAAAGGSSKVLSVGCPFVSPTGIAVEPDGQNVFVADAGANGILGVSVTGTARPMIVLGTEGTSPRNLDIVREGDQPMIYFTGTDVTDGQPALMKISATGAASPQVILKGAPLADPDGVAVGQDGVIYLSDHEGVGKVFAIRGGAIATMVGQVRLGHPGGIALTQDGSTLLVSSFQSTSRFDQVLVVNTATGASTIVTKVVKKNKSAGGIHRAYSTNEFAWSGLTAGGGGRVYRVIP